MRFKIFWLIFVIALAILAYLAFPIIKERYFGNGNSKEEPKSSFIPIGNNANQSDNSSQEPNAVDNTSDTSDLEKSLSGGKTTTDESASPVNINERNTSGESLTHITTEHCDNNCQAFAMDFKLLEYCQQVCGIASIKEVSNCDDKNNIEKDYCLKDLAVNKKDFSLCEKINDANIRLTCQNRIAQDIIEKQL